MCCPLLQWKDEWPDAIMYGCPGLREKKPAEGYEEEVGVDDAAPASWLGEIEAAHMKHEAVPIFNVPFFSEARNQSQGPSSTLLAAVL